MKSKINPFLRRSLALAASSVFLSMGSAHAATYNWDGDTSNDFTTPSNWVENGWTQWDNYIFGSAVTNGSVNLNLNGVDEYGMSSLTLESGLTQDIVIGSAGGSRLIMGTDQSSSLGLITIAAGSRDLTINSEYIASTAVTWDIGLGRTLTMAGQLNNWYNPASVVKDGAGTAVLSGSNGYSGGTTVNGGVLSFTGASSLPTSGAVTIAAGAKLSNDAPAGTSFNIGAVTLTGGELAATATPASDLGNFHLKGDVTVSGTATSTISADVRVIQGDNRTFSVASTGDASGVDLLISGKLGHYNNNSWGYATKTDVGTMKITGPMKPVASPSTMAS